MISCTKILKNRRDAHISNLPSHTGLFFPPKKRLPLESHWVHKLTVIRKVKGENSRVKKTCKRSKVHLATAEFVNMRLMLSVMYPFQWYLYHELKDLSPFYHSSIFNYNGKLLSLLQKGHILEDQSERDIKRKHRWTLKKERWNNKPGAISNLKDSHKPGSKRTRAVACAVDSSLVFLGFSCLFLVCLLCFLLFLSSKVSQSLCWPQSS